MEDGIIFERYRELACRAILTGINDFLSGKDSYYQFKRWVNQSVLFDYLSLDRERIIYRVLELKKRGVRAIKGGNMYGKWI